MRTRTFTHAFSYPANASPQGDVVSRQSAQYLPEARWRIANNGCYL